MRRLAFIAMLLVPGTGHAMLQRPDAPLLSDEEIGANLKDGEAIEGRVDGDLNGDGDIDTAYIVRGEDNRSLHVQFAVRSELELYHEPAGSAELDAYPMGAAELSISKGVLVVKDLTGGTSATAITYRYRGEKGRPKMRLIGLDATFYSRTFAHDGSEMSWNLLTGDVVATRLKLTGAADAAAYDKRESKRFKRPVRTYYMEDTPDIEEAMGMAMEGK